MVVSPAVHAPAAAMPDHGLYDVHLEVLVCLIAALPPDKMQSSLYARQWFVFMTCMNLHTAEGSSGQGSCETATKLQVA